MADYRMHHALRVAASGGLAGAARARSLAAAMARGGALAASTGRCGALALMLPVAAGGIVLALHALPPGVVSWDDAVDALLVSVRLSGPAAAGIAAWTAVADRHTGLGKLERLAIRSATSRPLGRLGAMAAVGLGGYAATAAGLAGWMLSHGPVAGTVPFAEVMAGLAALLCCVTAGFLAGNLAPSSGPTALPALAVAAAVWAVTSLAGPAGPGWIQGSGWWRLLVPPDLHHPLFTQWRPGLFSAELTWFAGLACAGVLAFCWTVGRRRRFLVAAIMPLLLAATGASWIHAERLHPVVPETTRLACQSWPLVICVHPALVRALPQLEPAFTTIAAHLAGTPVAIRELVQYPAGTGAPGGAAGAAGAARHGSFAFHLDTLTPGYERGLVAGLAAQIAPWCGGTAGQLNEPVRAWLLDTPMPGGVTSGIDTTAAGGTTGTSGTGATVATNGTVATRDAAGTAGTRRTAESYEVFRSYTEKQRRQWLRRHYRQLARCTLAPGDFRAIHAAHSHGVP